jgi:hypothetical protein
MGRTSGLIDVVFPCWVVAYRHVQWEQMGRTVHDLRGVAIGVYL